METASPRRRKASPDAAAAAGVALHPRLGAMNDEIVERARQDYLDALPIAAAVICSGAAGDLYVDMANAHFRRIAGWPGHEGKWVAQLPFFARTSLAEAVSAFLAGEETSRQCDRDEGEAVGGRHFQVQLARLKATPFAPTRCLLTLIDRTAQVETEKSLRAEMLRDSLTGLPNRIAFNERVEAILDEPDFIDGSHAVVVVDMTRFSRINECMGAIAGDELLITFARRLFSALRAGDILARTGGDEFGILVRLGGGLGEALKLAERIRATMSAPFRLSELEIRVDCSIGIAQLSGSVELAAEVLRNAQFALKQSKQSGSIQIYEPKAASAVRRRFSIETELRRAIERDELRLAFQPVIDLPTGTVSGFEALARWDHADGGSISPDEFIPVAEESGLIVSLGRWALDAAARTLGDWDREAGRVLPLSVAVNLSAIQIARDDIAGGVAGALHASGIEGGRLTLELTESAIIQDPARATRVLEALKGLDAKVAMDDFGTGYTSLSYLQRLPIDMLKIDRSFVTGMLGDRDSVAIIRAVLSLASALGMSTTAEGIESEELARTLAELGCGHGQGFFFSEPLPPDQALAYWLARNA